MPNTDIQTALDAIKEYSAERRTLANYYDGCHSLNFSTEKFKTTFGKQVGEARDNLCPIVVDAISDRMEVINFSGDNETEQTAANAWKLWQNSQMELVSNQTHTEALKTGSAFIIVWPDASNKAKFYLQNSLNCAVIEDPETEEPIFGAKMWKLPDGKFRLNLYYADRIEKFVTSTKPTDGVELKPTAFTEFSSEKEQAVEPNPYKVVPMFKFETNPVLSDVIPLQNALNKTLADGLVAAEFMAFPQRWATGLEPPENDLGGYQKELFKGGVDRLWATADGTVKFGQFDPVDIVKYTQVADSYRLEMARVSGTPLHFFAIQTSNQISGEALKTLESRFTKRIIRLQLSFGTTWARVMQLALTIEKQPASGNLTTQWQSPEQRSEVEFLTALGLKRDTLDVPVDTLREEYGYSAEDIADFNKENVLITVSEPPPTPNPNQPQNQVN